MRCSASFASFVFSLGLFGGCDDDKPRLPPIYNNSNDDVGSDIRDMTDEDATQECRGLFEGAPCDRDHASAVCVGGRCQLVICESGFRDCDSDDANGCESGTTNLARCGDCDTSCEGAETCQLGPVGWTCSEEIICPRDRYDLDQVLPCEWEATWGETLNAVPPDLVTHAGSFGRDTAMLVGTASSGTWAVEAQAVPQPVDLTAHDTSNRAIGIVGSSAQFFIVWQSGWNDGSQDLSDRCIGPRQHVAIGGDPAETFVASLGDVVKLEQGVEVARFGLADYLRSFYPYPDRVSLTEPVAPAEFELSAIETIACACVVNGVTAELATDPRCLGLVTCQDGTFDPSVCSGCAPSPLDCADFAIRNIDVTPQFVWVTTRRGVVVLSRELRAIARSETDARIGVLDGAGFVTSDVFKTGALNHLAFVESDGTVFEALTPTIPKMFSIDETSVRLPDVLSFTINAEFGVAHFEDRAELFSREGGAFLIDATSAPTASPVSRAIGSVASDSEFTVWFAYEGGVIPMYLTRDP